MAEIETGLPLPVEESGGAATPSGAWPYFLIWLLFGAGAGMALSSLTGLLSAVTGATAPARGAAVAAMLAAAWIGLSFLNLDGLDGGRGSRRGAAPLLLVSSLTLLVSPWVLPMFEAPAGALVSLARGVAPIEAILRLMVALPLAILPCAALGAAFASLSREQGWVGADRSSRALRMAMLAAGGALGMVNAGFRLYPWGGETAVAAAGAVLLFAAALLGGALRRDAGALPAGRVSQASGPDSGAPSLPVAAGKWGAVAWGAAVAVSLPAWDRILRLVFGPFPESMSRTAGMFLAGCSLGSLAVLARRRPGKRGGMEVAVLSGLAGIATLASLFLLDRLPLVYLSLSPLAAAAPFSFGVKSWGVAALLVLPAGLAYGALLPFLSGSAGETGGGMGIASRGGSRQMERILAGAFLASLCASTWLIPRVGFRTSLAGASALILAFSAVAFASSRGGSRVLRVAGVAAVLALTLLLPFRPLPGNPRLLASGVHRYSGEILSNFKGSLEGYRAARLKTTLPFYREGGEATVGVEEAEAEVSPIVALTEEGVVAGTTFFDLVPQILSAEIPLVMRPGARDALLVGYGTGIGAGSMLLHPLARLDLVETEPAVLEASRRFEPANRIPRADPRVRISGDDPRQFLRGKGAGSYDLILFDTTMPEEASARFQFTSSFYRLAASRLRKGGLFAQVLPLQGLSPADLASVVKTAGTAFSDLVLLQTYYQEALLLGSGDPIQFDLDEMASAIGADKVQSDLGRIGLASPEAIVVRHRLSGKGLAAFARSGRLLTDRGAPLSWSGYRVGSALKLSDSQNAMDRFSTGLGTRIAHLGEGAAGNAVLVRLAQSAIGAGDAMRAADLADALLARGDAADGHQVLGDAYYARQEQISSVAEWHKALEADPKNVNALRSLADFSSDRQSFAAAEDYLRQALAVAPDDPEVLFHHGRALYYLKRYKESEADLAKALQAKGETKAPLTLYYLGLIQKEKKNLTGAAEFLRRYLQWAYAQGRLTPVEAEVHLALAEIYTGLNLPDLAEKQKKAGEVLQLRLKAMAKSKEEAAIEWLKKP